MDFGHDATIMHGSEHVVYSRVLRLGDVIDKDRHDQVEDAHWHQHGHHHIAHLELPTMLLVELLGDGIAFIGLAGFRKAAEEREHARLGGEPTKSRHESILPAGQPERSGTPHDRLRRRTS